MFSFSHFIPPGFCQALCFQLYKAIRSYAAVLQFNRWWLWKYKIHVHIFFFCQNPNPFFVGSSHLIRFQHWLNFPEIRRQMFLKFFVMCLICSRTWWDRPYGCFYHDLYNDDYTELGVISFTKTVTLDRYHSVSRETGEGDNRMIKTDSYFCPWLIDHFFYDSSYRLKSSSLLWYWCSSIRNFIKLCLRQVFVWLYEMLWICCCVDGKQYVYLVFLLLFLTSFYWQSREVHRWLVRDNRQMSKYDLQTQIEKIHLTVGLISSNLFVSVPHLHSPPRGLVSFCHCSRLHAHQVTIKT